MSFSESIKLQAMVACGRSCAICHKFCGTNMEVHHIIQHADGGADDIDNAIPLCFNCHADVGHYNPHHPKGIKYTEAELRQHRDNWYEKVRNTSSYSSSSEHLAMDKATYAKLEYYLPRHKIERIRDIEFAAEDFPKDYFDEIDRFYDASINPIYEYMDADVEKRKADLADSIWGLIKAINESMIIEKDVLHVPPEWEYDQPERFLKVGKKLNTISEEVYKRYDDYIRICRRKLLVEVE